MPADQIIVIRHAQKPTRKPKCIGIRDAALCSKGTKAGTPEDRRYPVAPG